MTYKNLNLKSSLKFNINTLFILILAASNNAVTKNQLITIIIYPGSKDKTIV